jgi:hypothetical protein
LLEKYQPDDYNSVSNLRNEEDEKNYCIMQEITKRLSILYETVEI